MTTDEATLRAKIKATVPRLATHELDALVEVLGPMVGAVVPNIVTLSTIFHDEYIKTHGRMNAGLEAIRAHLLTLSGWRPK